jgi:hypothetical protein
MEERAEAKTRVDLMQASYFSDLQLTCLSVYQSQQGSGTNFLHKCSSDLITIQRSANRSVGGITLLFDINRKDELS